MTSIWLLPEGRQEQRLQELINRLAEEHATVAFAPHLTVCGVPGDLAVLDAAAAYVRECGLLPLRVAKAAVTGAVTTPFRAVFIEVKNSPELREFRERLRDIVGAPQLIPPHISLLYTLDRNFGSNGLSRRSTTTISSRLSANTRHTISAIGFRRSLPLAQLSGPPELRRTMAFLRLTRSLTPAWKVRLGA
jgi:hypothetical protein